jgi:hypothetical protein
MSQAFQNLSTCQEPGNSIAKFGERTGANRSDDIVPFFFSTKINNFPSQRKRTMPAVNFFRAMEPTLEVSWEQTFGKTKRVRHDRRKVFDHFSATGDATMFSF